MTTIATDVRGFTYEIDTITGKCRKIFQDYADVEIENIDYDEVNLQVYQKYLQDKTDEPCPLKNGNLHFRGYKMYFDRENGFQIQDTANKYRLIDHPFEGIPKPKQLYEFFIKPQIQHTPEELSKAAERGRKNQEDKKKITTCAPEEIDYELLRKKVLNKIVAIRDGSITGVQPEEFSGMIPFKRWARQVNERIRAWRDKKMRYPHLLEEVEKLTRAETFSSEKIKVEKFRGTQLPEFNEVGSIVGTSIEVDGKSVPAMPFLTNCLLYWECRCMYALMAYLSGQITENQLLEKPFEKYPMKYNRHLLANTEDNIRVINELSYAVGIVPPQDCIYTGLNVGDKLRILVAGKWTTQVVSEVEGGICVGRGVAILKSDTWEKIS